MMLSLAAIMSQTRDGAYRRHHSSKRLWIISPSPTTPQQERDFRAKMENLEQHASTLTFIGLDEESSRTWLREVAAKESLTFPKVTTLMLDLRKIFRVEEYVNQIKQILHRPGAFPELRRLTLTRFWFNSKDLRELADMQPVIQVELLSFWGNEVGDFSPLWATTDRSNLVMLGLGNNRFGDSVLLQLGQALASNKFPQLTLLDIEGVWYDRPGREAFAEALRGGACPHLKSIDLSTLHNEVPLLADLDDDLKSICREREIEIDLGHGSEYQYGVELQLETVQEPGDEECGICLEEYKVGEEVHVSACGHRFHRGCLFDWRMRTDTDICPICRSVLPTTPLEQAWINDLKGVMAMMA